MRTPHSGWVRKFRVVGEFAFMIAGPTPCGLREEFSLTNFFMSAYSAPSAGNTMTDRAIATAAMVLPMGPPVWSPADLSRDPTLRVQGARAHARRRCWHSAAIARERGLFANGGPIAAT